ncbi:hypothetical protein V1514DRAFT_340719 [Lipomyces japonicus]|uniref:uncharacterized protein n=1 Tax=Lipomyces japonicus TaxID=56871 RepID=UPI0034CDAFD4
MAVVSYLSVMDGVVNSQFAFCVYVIGRALLSHASITKSELRSEVETIVESLIEMSKRWVENDSLTARLLKSLMARRQDFLQSQLQQPVFSFWDDHSQPNLSAEFNICDFFDL